MTLWLVRAGRYGEHEQKYLSDSRIYLTWGLPDDLSKSASRKDIVAILGRERPGQSKGRNSNHSGQIYTFVHGMKPGDLVAVPSKVKPAVHIAEISGGYQYDPQEEPTYCHSRAVKWLAQDVPRSTFDQQMLYSLGAIQTICEISRDNAEGRVRAMLNAPASAASQASSLEVSATPAEEAPIDLERAGKDEIARLIIRKFKGHGLATVVDAILRAQGFLTFKSPEGADKGIDILAAPAPLGFGSPRICVQVKSQESPVDRPTMDQLIGAMQNVHADQGLLVSWGGFKSSVDRERAAQFFRVRLWDQDSLLEQLFLHYDKLDEDIRAELPLKRVWIAVHDEEE